MAEYYSARALEYDRVYQKPERQSDIQTLTQWIRSKFIGRRVLDIAAGTGYWTQHFAPAANSVAALDVARETLAVAAQVLPSNVSLAVGDAYRLPFKLRAFDGCFVGFWLSHVPRRRWPEFFSGLHAVLAGSARVVILDNLYVEGSNYPIAETDAEGNTYQLRQLLDGSTYRVLKNFPTQSELCELVGTSGWKVEHTAWEYYWALEYRVVEGVRGAV